MNLKGVLWLHRKPRCKEGGIKHKGCVFEFNMGVGDI